MKRLFLLACVLYYSAGCVAMDQKVFIPSTVEQIKQIKTVVTTVPFAISSNGKSVIIHGKKISRMLFPKNVKFVPQDKEWLAFTDGAGNTIGVISLVESKLVQLSMSNSQNYYRGGYDDAKSKTKVWADCPVYGFKKLFENEMFKLLKRQL